MSQAPIWFERKFEFTFPVEELGASLFDRAIPYPRLETPMRLVDHLYFVAEHDDHHLSRIWGLVKNVE